MTPVAFSPDGQHIGAGGYSIRVWQVGITAQPLIDSKEYSDSCDFSPDGTVFAAFGAERAIMRWEIPSGSPLTGGWGGTRASNGNVRFPVGGMTFHPDGSMIANCYGVLGKRGFDSVIHLWNSACGSLVDTLKMECMYAHPSTLAFSPDGALLAANTGPILHVWDIQQRSEIATFHVSKKHFKDFAFTADGQALLAINHETEVHGWNTVNWNGFTYNPAQIGKLTAIAVSKLGSVAVGSSSGKVMIF